MPFGWESGWDVSRSASRRPSWRVFNAFRLGVRLGRKLRVTLGLTQASSMPFGWESGWDVPAAMIAAPSVLRLQCLSAGSPVGTARRQPQDPTQTRKSSMPFGWESGWDGDWLTEAAARARVFNAFRLGVRLGPPGRWKKMWFRRQSSMPFGWESGWDSVRTVTSSMLPRSSMPFGWESGWDRGGILPLKNKESRGYPGREAIFGLSSA